MTGANYVLELPDGWHDGPLFIVVTRQIPIKHRYRSGWARRRHQERRSTPAWVDHSELRRLHELSKQLTRETGIQHSRDHIVPLHHPMVCGLHVPWNIQIIPLADNVKKSNNYWPDAPFEQLSLF